MKKETLGQLIRQDRGKISMTQLELSKKLGYDTVQFVSLMERGVSKVPLKTLGKLIVILGMNEKSIIKDILNDYETEIRTEIESGKKAINKK